ncbi:hypothetical protein [Rhodococcus sp. I2R]|uniref:hypothetical protein n=1 Tax=Rhodococcus sp. I2R TaxID=2855445 RepID=UPI001E307EEE|nr:hypothetical protein [Rhodococcus sp. I2R]MCC8927330.1 hypothetical protein [Rhodococcus sp. I2R]
MTDLTAIFTAKATELGLALDADDLAVLQRAQQASDAADRCARELESPGIGSTAMKTFMAEQRAQSLAQARLMADMDRRLGVAAAQGGARGIRGTYTGDGSQNSARDAERANRRGETRQSRTAQRRA